MSSIPTNTEPVTREIMNSCIPIHRRKKRRKSSSSSGKWPRTDNVIDSDDRHDGHGDDDRSGDYEHGKDDTGNPTDDGKKYLKILFIKYFILGENKYNAYTYIFSSNYQSINQSIKLIRRFCVLCPHFKDFIVCQMKK